MSVIGAVHLYLFWSGDILNHSAIIGSVAFLFVRLPLRWLLICAGVFLALQLAAELIPAAEVPRSLMVVGYASLLMLLMQPGSWLTTRITAVGRAALTNHLGTTLMMTFIFSGWGLGQFGSWSRAQLYLLVPVAWAIMLCWSEPWLDHYRYGPMEWVWRSLSRLKLQPMRKLANAIR